MIHQQGKLSQPPRVTNGSFALLRPHANAPDAMPCEDFQEQRSDQGLQRA